MSDDKSFLQETISSLKQQRVELAVQMHLAKAEAKEEWEKLEERFQKLSDEYEPIKDALGETAENVLSGLKLTAEELLAGFDRVRKSL
jgi:chromosome segregation ATPase